MKTCASLILAIVLPQSLAFCPIVAARFRTSLSSGIVTGPKGKPASSFEEDLLLTLKIIQDHDARSVTVSKEQFISQMKEAARVVKEEKIDLSIPYDAPARLAYEFSDKSVPYPKFKKNYESNAVAEVKAKRVKAKGPAKVLESPKTVDLSIPYDAAAKLAYESSDKSMPYAAFKVKFEDNAVEEVKAKRQPKVVESPKANLKVDLSIPYDAAAKLAYEKSDKSIPYSHFKIKYEQDSIAEIISKKVKKLQ